MGGPFWRALWDNEAWPGGIGLVLAAVGLVQDSLDSRGSRKGILSIIAIAVIVLAYLLLPAPMNFA